MKLANAMDLVEEAMQVWPYSAARFNGEETVEVVFTDSNVELREILHWMKQKPGVVTSWAKPN